MISGDHVYPCLRVMAGDGAVFVMESGSFGLKLEHFVTRVFKQHPEVALAALKL